MIYMHFTKLQILTNPPDILTKLHGHYVQLYVTVNWISLLSPTAKSSICRILVDIVDTVLTFMGTRTGRGSRCSRTRLRSRAEREAKGWSLAVASTAIATRMVRLKIYTCTVAHEVLLNYVRLSTYISLIYYTNTSLHANENPLKIHLIYHFFVLGIHGIYWTSLWYLLHRSIQYLYWQICTDLMEHQLKKMDIIFTQQAIIRHWLPP